MACYEKRCVVPNERGIHARPSGLIVDATRAELLELGFSKKDFAGKILVRFDQEESVGYDASETMSLLQMAAAQGRELVVYTNCPKCRKIVNVIADIINKMKSFDK